MVGGLIVSQALTLFTTPVVYLYFDRLAARFRGFNANPDDGVLPAGDAATTARPTAAD